MFLTFETTVFLMQARKLNHPHSDAHPGARQSRRDFQNVLAGFAGFCGWKEALEWWSYPAKFM